VILLPGILVPAKHFSGFCLLLLLDCIDIGRRTNSLPMWMRVLGWLLHSCSVLIESVSPRSRSADLTPDRSLALFANPRYRPMTFDGEDFSIAPKRE
jgi:hypothetical protein